LHDVRGRVAVDARSIASGSDTVQLSVTEPTASDVDVQRVRPSWGPFVLVVYIGLIVCTNIATAVWARWVNSNPEGLLLLSSRNRYLALTLASGVSVPTWAAIATVRIAAAFVTLHLLGRAYGDDILRFLTRFAGVTQEAIDFFNEKFARYEWIVISLFVGSNIVAALSGIHKTQPAKLATWLAVGIAGRLALMWWLARTFEDWLVEFLEWLQRWQWPIVAISVIFVILVNIRNFRRG